MDRFLLFIFRCFYPGFICPAYAAAGAFDFSPYALFLQFTEAGIARLEVKEGQQVVRGEEIGLAGSTGKSTGPHVHYEVWIGKNDVNPINYYFMDLNVEQYEEMISLAENHGKVFD